MNGRYFSFGASGNPLAQILSLVVFGVLLVVAVIMGAFVLLTLLGIAVIGFVAFSIRGWWLRRKHGGRGPTGRGPGGSGGPGEAAKSIRYIEAEYEVVDGDADADAERRRSREQR
jgi:hypothetical protein